MKPLEVNPDITCAFPIDSEVTITLWKGEVRNGESIERVLPESPIVIGAYTDTETLTRFSDGDLVDYPNEWIVAKEQELNASQ